jgi:hypothetical protein
MEFRENGVALYYHFIGLVGAISVHLRRFRCVVPDMLLMTYTDDPRQRGAVLYSAPRSLLLKFAKRGLCVSDAMLSSPTTSL